MQLQSAAPAAAAAVSRQSKASSCSSMPGSKPIVLFLSLEDCSEQLLKGVHGQLLHTLDDHCTVKLITTKKEARAALEDPQVRVAVANDKMAAVVTKPFLQRGGTVIYAACFASQTCSADVDAAFKAMGLMWRHGSYYRSDFYPTAAASLRFSSSSSLPLPSRYNSKAVLLQHVHPEHRCYCPTKRSLIQSPVHPAVPVEDLSEAAVAFAPIGSNGWVGYIGSVSSTLDTSAVVLAMVHWANRQQQQH